ncbi:trans-homoaconitate synthase [compost metagenome]
MKERSTYQTFDPAEVGRSHRFVLGKHSGTGGVIHALGQWGLAVSADTAERLLERVRDYAESCKGTVPEYLLVQWLMEERQRGRRAV